MEKGCTTDLLYELSSPAAVLHFIDPWQAAHGKISNFVPVWGIFARSPINAFELM